MEHQKNPDVLERRIILFGWFFVGLGFVAAILGLVVAADTAGGFNLNNLGAFGSYLQGSVSSLWALAGLMFIL